MTHTSGERMPGAYLFRISYPKRDQPHVHSTFSARLSVLVKGEEAPFLTEKGRSGVKTPRGLR